MSTYLQILTFSIALPLLFSFHPKINFHLKWKYFFISNLLVGIPFLIWDYIFTKKGVWGFSSEHISGLKIANLPIEEIMFFILIPYCFIFTYEVFNKLEININERKVKKITLILGILILVIGILTTPYLYTCVTFISLSLILISISQSKQVFLGRFYISFVIITCIPFMIVNGLLTGIAEDSLQLATVIYNDDERYFNRILTIPIEDFFYSMLLLLTNTWVYELIKNK